MEITTTKEKDKALETDNKAERRALAESALRFITEDDPAFIIETDNVVVMGAVFTNEENTSLEILCHLAETFEVAFLAERDHEDEDEDEDEDRFFAVQYVFEEANVKVYVTGATEGRMMSLEDLSAFFKDYKGKHEPMHYANVGLPPSLGIVYSNPQPCAGCPHHPN